MLRTTCHFICLLFAALLFASTSTALDIQVSFHAAGSLPEDYPAFDPDVTLLGGIVEYAASVYEDLIDDPHLVTLTYRWDRDLAETNDVTTGLHTFLTESGGRETSGRLRFDPDAPWYIDPMPEDDSEYNMAPVLFQDLTATQQNSRFGGGVPETFEAGYRGSALASAPASARNNYDLLSIVFHEMGHALGMSGGLSSLLSETIDGDYDVDPFFVGGSSMQELARNTDTTNNRAHLVGFGTSVPTGEVAGPALMSTVGRGERRHPSAADLVAMARPSNWLQLDLQRLQSLGGESWHDELSWLGGAIPDADDEVSIRSGGEVRLSDNALAGVLLVDDGSTVATGVNVLVAVERATVGATGEVVVGGVLMPAADGTFQGNHLTIEPGGVVRLNGGDLAGDAATVNMVQVEMAGTIAVDADTWGVWNGATEVTGNSIVCVGAGSQLSMNGDLSGTADLTKMGAGTLVLDGGNGSWSGDLMIAEGAVLAALGPGVGNLLNQGGSLSPGTLADPTGVLTLDGAFNNSADGTLTINLGGRIAGDHDQLSLLQSAASLGGSLEVNLADAFIPDLGDAFTILEAGAIGGSFGIVDLPAFNGLTFEVIYNPQSVVLQVIEEVGYAADFDSGGNVDGTDLVRWRANFGLEGTATRGRGDADGDADVDGADFLVWQRQLGSSAPAVSPNGPVPEPATFLLFIAATAGIRRMGGQMRHELVGPVEKGRFC